MLTIHRSTSRLQSRHPSGGQERSRRRNSSRVLKLSRRRGTRRSQSRHSSSGLKPSRGLFACRLRSRCSGCDLKLSHRHWICRLPGFYSSCDLKLSRQWVSSHGEPARCHVATRAAVCSSVRPGGLPAASHHSRSPGSEAQPLQVDLPQY